MKLFAIYGNPVKHSRSPLMHNNMHKKLGINACYTRILLEDGSKLKENFFSLSLAGANVTVPHKEEAFKQCDEVRGIAKKIGAVNTLVNEKGRMIGYNTDAEGFLRALGRLGEPKSILILGAGGTARALALIFTQQGYKTTIINRSSKRLDNFYKMDVKKYTFENFKQKSYDLVVNTTSAGLNDDNLPAPQAILNGVLENAKYAADVIYGKQTPFLQLANEKGLPTLSGEEMLLQQGVLASLYFHKNKINAKKIERHFRESFKF